MLLDPDIRHALVRKRLRYMVKNDDGLIVHELGLAHARSRIDVAVVNGLIHGFEIKGTNDSLERLQHQLDIYIQSLQKLTMVVAERHVEQVMKTAPCWCGVIAVTRGKREAVNFERVQASKRNQLVDRYMMAHLLWRNEVQAILVSNGVCRADLRAPRAILYRRLIAEISERDLTAEIKLAMTKRQAWRDHLRPL